uniref:PAS-like domain-containing protein n=1 Tax=Bionectria ochroleuca TaxID=29856 RepID=A0A8H7N7Q2_BIOOC
MGDQFDQGTGWTRRPPPPHTYGGITWTCSTLRRRFRFVSGNTPLELIQAESPAPLPDAPAAIDQQGEDPSPDIPLTPEVDPVDPSDYFGDARRKSSQAESIVETIPEDPLPDTESRHHPDDFTNEVLQAQIARPCFDWTRIPLMDDLPEHIRLARTTDWSSTSLGPTEDWPHELRAMSNLVMGSPHPAALYWGPDFVSIYNAAYIDLAGQKHPSLMGAKYTEAWAEIWDDIAPVFQAAWESGQATMKNDNQLFINRHGFLEETFFSWSIVPLVGADGEVVGLYNPAFENTRRKVTNRRMLTLREVGERTSLATSMKGFWPQVQKGLEYNEYDVPSPYCTPSKTMPRAKSPPCTQPASTAHSCVSRGLSVSLQTIPSLLSPWTCVPRTKDLPLICVSVWRPVEAQWYYLPKMELCQPT